jgi:hypothetical protein
MKSAIWLPNRNRDRSGNRQRRNKECNSLIPIFSLFGDPSLSSMFILLGHSQTYGPRSTSWSRARFQRLLSLTQNPKTDTEEIRGKLGRRRRCPRKATPRSRLFPCCGRWKPEQGWRMFVVKRGSARRRTTCGSVSGSCLQVAQIESTNEKERLSLFPGFRRREILASTFKVEV